MSYEDRDIYGIYRSNGNGARPEVMGAETLLRTNIHDQKGESLGDIKEIMLDMRSGKVSYAVLSFRSFLGMTEKLIAAPWNALTLDSENKRFVLNVDRGRLKTAPELNKGNWPNMADQAWESEIHSYFGTKPNMDPPSA